MYWLHSNQRRNVSSRVLEKMKWFSLQLGNNCVGEIQHHCVRTIEGKDSWHELFEQAKKLSIPHNRFHIVPENEAVARWLHGMHINYTNQFSAFTLIGPQFPGLESIGFIRLWHVFNSWEEQL